MAMLMLSVDIFSVGLCIARLRWGRELEAQREESNLRVRLQKKVSFRRGCARGEKLAYQYLAARLL